MRVPAGHGETWCCPRGASAAPPLRPRPEPPAVTACPGPEGEAATVTVTVGRVLSVRSSPFCIQDPRDECLPVQPRRALFSSLDKCVSLMLLESALNQPFCHSLQKTAELMPDLSTPIAYAFFNRNSSHAYLAPFLFGCVVVGLLCF